MVGLNLLKVLEPLWFGTLTNKIRKDVWFMEIGNRIIHDQDGRVLSQTGEMRGDVLPHKEITELHFVDLEYGQIDISKYRIVGIDMVTRQPILEELPIYESEEQRRIRELEDELLLQADAELGGIL